MFQTVDDDNLALVHEFSLGDYGDGVPGAYPLGLSGCPITYPPTLNGCGDGLPSEYCEGATGSSAALGGIGMFEMGNLPLYSALGIGAIAGYFLGGKKLSSAAFGAAAGALVMGLARK